MRVYDARGQAIAESIEVKPTVLVNVQRVEVRWVRTGNALNAVIPTPAGHGPWVVRVEVNDEFGDPAGRDFLEVAGDSEQISAR